MRLTNLQLRVLSDKIMKKLREKFENSSNCDEITKRIKKEMNYEEVVQIVKKYEKLSKQREKINAEMSRMSNKFYSENSMFLPGNVKNLDSIIDSKVKNEIFKSIPSVVDIESDIVLMTMEGSTDIFSKLLAKYGIED